MATGALHVLALRHIMVEHLGAFERHFKNSGAKVTYLDLAAGEPLPQSHRGYDLLVILGGPMSVNDADRWIDAEKQFIRDALGQNKTIVGICLGAQMIASALGAKVSRGAHREVGFGTVELTPEAADDPLLSEFQRPQMVFHLHGEGFDNPPGAVRLAWSDRYPNQAFRLGSRCWGLQFHVELDAQMLDQWIVENWGDPRQLPSASRAHQIMREAPSLLPRLERCGERVARRLLEIAGEAG